MCFFSFERWKAVFYLHFSVSAQLAGSASSTSWAPTPKWWTWRSPTAAWQLSSDTWCVFSCCFWSVSTKSPLCWFWYSKNKKKRELKQAFSWNMSLTWQQVSKGLISTLCGDLLVFAATERAESGRQQNKRGESATHWWLLPFVCVRNHHIVI